MTIEEHWTQAGHMGFRKLCSAPACEQDVAWETARNYWCAAHRPRHPFRWRTEPEVRFP